MIASIIWCRIDALDASVADSGHMNTEPDSDNSEGSKCIIVGSSLPITTLAELEWVHGDDEAWTGLRKNIGKAFSGYFNCRITFNSHEEVRPQFFRAQFKVCD